mgnify:CR=1 FL=1
MSHDFHDHPFPALSFTRPGRVEFQVNSKGPPTEPPDNSTRDEFISQLKNTARSVVTDVRMGNARVDRLLDCHLREFLPEPSKAGHQRILGGLANTLGYGSWTELQHEIDAGRAPRNEVKNGNGGRLPINHEIPEDEFQDRSSTPATFGSGAISLLEEGLECLKEYNRLAGLIGWSDGRVTIAGRSYGPGPLISRTHWSGTGFELIDKHILKPAGMPRPWLRRDYRGFSGDPEYVDRRVKLGFLQHLYAEELAKRPLGNALSRQLRLPEVSEAVTQVIEMTDRLRDSMDTLWQGGYEPPLFVVEVVQDTTLLLERLLQKIGTVESEDLLDQDVLFLELLRYSTWLLRRFDCVAPYCDSDILMTGVSQPHDYLEPAIAQLFVTPDLRSPRLERFFEDQVIPSVQPPPNAIDLKASFDWTMRPRKG